MSNNSELFKSFSVLIFSFASFCLGFLLSLCLNRPKEDSYRGYYSKKTTSAQANVSHGHNDRFLLDDVRLQMESGLPIRQIEFGQPLGPCCEILLFPDEKLPCHCYYKSLINFVGNVRCHDRKRQKIHRFDRGKSSLIEMMKVMRHASQIDICVMNLASWELADFLSLLKQKGTKIRIIADDGKEFKKGTKLPLLIKKGFEVRIPGSSQENATDQYRAIMHHKFAVIDNEATLLGSLNWTGHGILKNRELVLVSRSKSVASTLSKEFESLWAQFQVAQVENFE